MKVRNIILKIDFEEIPYVKIVELGKKKEIGTISEDYILGEHDGKFLGDLEVFKIGIEEPEDGCMVGLILYINKLEKRNKNSIQMQK